jgi:hypothetical protein
MCLSGVSVSCPLAGPGVRALIPAAWPGAGDEDDDAGIDAALNFCWAGLVCQALFELRLRQASYISIGLDENWQQKK